MKQTINGKTYNTETAELIADVSADCGCRDLCYWETGLYVTKKGNYFLSGSGGPLTTYARSISYGNTSGGSRISPITREEALEWCEQHQLQDAIESYFASDIEDA